MLEMRARITPARATVSLGSRVMAPYERRPIRHGNRTHDEAGHAILWRFIGQAHRKGNLPGCIKLDDEWCMGPGGKELVAFGRKPADHDQSAFQGIHALSPAYLGG
jgi:hypothetical protein